MAYRERHRLPASLGVWLILVMSLHGCTTPTSRAMTQANRHRLVSELVDGKPYRHQIFFQLGSDRDRLLVFIEGDGRPWERGGSVPSKDPTPRRPLALELA